MDNKYKGYLLVLGTAIISGFSIFINKYGVKETDPYVFTFVKNLIASLPFLFLAIPYFKEIKKLNIREKLLFFAIAIIGGSIPFLFFFKGLTIASAANASFIHKTMFIYIALFGLYFLKEKLNFISIVGFVALIFGSLLFFNIQPGKLGIGELYIFIATLMWAVEMLVSKKLLSKISPNLVSFSRMFLGSGIILSYLFITQKAGLLVHLNNTQWLWLMIGGILLFGYVFTFYRGLKVLSAAESSAILTLGAPITALLTLGFQGKNLLPGQPVAVALIFLSLFIIIMGKDMVRACRELFNSSASRRNSLEG